MADASTPQGQHITTKLSGLIPIGAAIVAIALGWGEMKSQMVAEQKFRDDAFLKMNQELARSAALYDKLEGRIRELEAQGARVDERFTLLLTLMQELKVQVGALNEKSFTR